MHPALEAALAKASKENIDREANESAPAPDQVELEATFLRRWAKSRSIRRQDSGSTFWACGRNMTKISYKMAEALVAAGHATLQGDPRNAGATLTMKKK